MPDETNPTRQMVTVDVRLPYNHLETATLAIAVDSTPTELFTLLTEKVSVTSCPSPSGRGSDRPTLPHDVQWGSRVVK